MELLILIVTGFVAGFAATKLLKTPSYGVPVDTIIGAFGAYAAGTLFAMLGITAGSLIVATLAGVVGGVALHAVLHALPKQ